jgi:hypothetical protein
LIYQGFINLGTEYRAVCKFSFQLCCSIEFLFIMEVHNFMKEIEIRYLTQEGHYNFTGEIKYVLYVLYLLPAAVLPKFYL